MTPFEVTYLALRGLLPVVPRLVARRARAFLRTRGGAGPARVLDIGGRNSNYTIGLPARVTVTDLPRESRIQHDLGLGITDALAARTRSRRSNIEDIVYDDMTRSALPDAAFDCVVSVEVIEHVEADDAFVRNMHRVLRPGGGVFLSTPNGDYLENTNPDHVRHYAREELRRLLERYFDRVEVEYAVAGGWARTAGLARWTMRRPLRTLKGMLGNVVNGLQSSRASLRDQATGTHHLVASAYKAAGPSEGPDRGSRGA